MEQRSLIVTFYAYKGGTGRTLALANVARFLADEMGYRVGLVDLDIDSPGLVHEPLCDSLDNEPRRSDLLMSIDKHRGFLDCFIERFSRIARGESVLPSISDFVVSLNSGGGGSILLMPTAAGSVSKADEYGATVASFMKLLASGSDIEPEQLSGRPPSLVASPGPVALGIFEEFAQKYNLDFLFLDGRTGTGPFAPVYVFAIPHLLVLFLGLNDQNILGSLSIFNAKAEGESTPAPVFLVASPVPTVGPEKFEERLRFIAAELAELRASRESENERYIYDLPRRPDHILPYSDAASFGEVYFPGKYPHSLLAKAYRRLAFSIEGLVLKEGGSPSAVISEDERALAEYEEQARNLRSPISVSLENVHKDVISSMVERFGIETRPLLSPEQAETGKWETLRKSSEEDLDGLRPQLPDILIIPQILLQTLSEKCSGTSGPLLHDLSQQRISKQNGIDFGLLDDNYPSWRRWCSVGQKIMALPFSVNAMLFCANEAKLAPVCRSYWRARGQEPPRDFFLPSSWTSVIDLVRSWPATRNVRFPFRIVGNGRGLYYEWLNLVTALGGFDIIQAEGRLIQDVTLDSSETINATKLFVELARLCPRDEQATSMSHQILDFAADRLPLYVGWTDSFRFNWSNGLPSGVSVVPVDETPSKVKTICLGRCPRDMRFRRTSLVDGWLMTFPNKQDPTSLGAALKFAHWFLRPLQQEALIRQGFPSASGTAISHEIEALNTARLTLTDAFVPNAERSFEVFLHTMKSAVYGGSWVASPKKLAPDSSEVYDEIVGTIAKLIKDEGADVAAEMSALAVSVRKAVGLA